MRLILRNDLETWASTFYAKGDFPILISQLARATADRSTLIDFPSGSAVFVGGWDGIVRTAVQTEYIPLGTSLWEFGTGDDNSGKATSDFDKRTLDPLGEDPSTSTFVFATPTFWRDKNTWRNDKMKEGKWKDIRVYDSSTLEQWLAITPVVSKWFASKCGKPGDGVLTAEEFWEEWSSLPKGLKLPPKSVTSGRSEQLIKLQTFLGGDAGIMAVRAPSKSEAIAFIIASAKQFPAPEQEYFFSKSLVAEAISVIRQINGYQVKMNIIVNVDTESGILHTSVGKGNHVLVPLGPDDPYSSEDIIRLGGIDKDGLIDALNDMGMERDSAANYVKESGCNITILKRLLGYFHKLDWAVQENIQEIIPAMILGRWDEAKLGDIQTLEQLSGENYNDYIKKVAKWKDSETAIFLNIGTAWRLTSPMDSWTNLAQFLTHNDFEKLKTVVLSVLTQKNPALEVEPEKRQFASVFGKESSYSTWSREGLLQSLILVGLYGKHLRIQQFADPQSWVDQVIRDLLSSDDGKVWASLNYQMPLIAEASPTSFLNAVEKSLSKEDKPIMEMFSEEASIISSTSRHTGLLWALEGLAWMPEYLSKSALLLAKLAAVDPGGNLANRPINSLKEIFKAWHHQTFASFEERMDVLRLISKKEKQIAWQLLATLLPKGGNDVGQYTNKLRWRLFNQPFKLPYTPHEVFKTYSEVTDIILSIFDYTEDQLADLINYSRNMGSNDMDKVLSFIEDNYDKVSAKTFAPWDALRNILYWENSHRDKSEISDIELARYVKLYHDKEPKDEIKSQLWLFNENWPHFAEGYIHEEGKHEDQEKLIHEKRLEALRKIYYNHGFEKVKELKSDVKEQFAFGNTLAYIIKKEDEIISLTKELEMELSEFMRAFLFRITFINGYDWLISLFNTLKERGYTSKALGRLFTPVLPDTKIWKFLESKPEVEREYWLGMNYHFHNMSEEDTLFGLNKLIEVHRYLTAIDAVRFSLKKVSSDTIVQLLEKLATEKSNDNNKSIRGYEISQLFDELKKRNNVARAKMVTLEWYYLSVLTEHGSTQKPNLLYEEMANNTDFFIDLLKWVYLPKDRSLIAKEREGITDEKFDQTAQQAFKLLHSWTKIPGVDQNGILDEKFLNEWVEKVREKASVISRLEVADMSIGKILAQYPEEDENFNTDAIYSVIEEINTDSIKNNFSAALFNKRGSSSRGPFDGGNIERGHAKYFAGLASKYKNKFPYVSEIFKNLSRNYEADAIRMDESAQKDKLDYS